MDNVIETDISTILEMATQSNAMRYEITQDLEGNRIRGQNEKYQGNVVLICDCLLLTLLAYKDGGRYIGHVSSGTLSEKGCFDEDGHPYYYCEKGLDIFGEKISVEFKEYDPRFLGNTCYIDWLGKAHDVLIEKAVRKLGTGPNGTRIIELYFQYLKDTGKNINITEEQNEGGKENEKDVQHRLSLYLKNEYNLKVISSWYTDYLHNTGYKEKVERSKKELGRYYVKHLKPLKRKLVKTLEKRGIMELKGISAIIEEKKEEVTCASDPQP